jgi:prophage regulatory protein
MSETFLTLPEVCAEICLRKSWVYDAVRRGDFPKPIRLTPRRVAWRESEIEKWKAAKVAERDAG